MESPRPEPGLSRPASGPAADPAASLANPHPSASPAAANLPAPPAAEILRIAPDLIETMRLEQGRVALWPGHRARLRTSALILGYPLDAAALDGWLAERIRALDADKAAGTRPGTDTPPASAPRRLRLLLAADGRLSLEAAPLPPTPEPVRIALAADVLGPEATLDAGDPWLRHKTTHRPGFAAAQRWLQAHPDHFDLIFGNTAGELCEGSRCTIYVRDTAGAWLTPPLACGLLPGVRRQALLDEGLAREARLSLEDLRQAPALRVSNALRGWMRSDMK
ncbi:aminotransferase class IV [Castellaniella sp.]|uniref:aminotransferase class IV n=1 Tax=Castellaniella sp. TaxID=1955812 RepID=UPI002AFF2E55|nr:aminotransferase class IV [Castellaniella sp.]